MPLLNFSTKKSKTNIEKIDTKGHKLPDGHRVHAFDPDHNPYHGTPHVHLADGKVLNIFTGKIYNGKKVVSSMGKKQLSLIRKCVIEKIISVADGKFNLDGNSVFVHIDKSDPLPTKVHVHSDNKTFSSDNKVYDLGFSNLNLSVLHKKLDQETNLNSILSNLDKLYKVTRKDQNISDSLRNKLKTLVEATHISREYLKDKYGIDFESHDLDYF